MSVFLVLLVVGVPGYGVASVHLNVLYNRQLRVFRSVCSPLSRRSRALCWMLFNADVSLCWCVS